MTESEGSDVFSHMWKPGSNPDVRGTLDNGGESPAEQWGGLGKVVGEGCKFMKETLVLMICTYVRIPMPISISCMGKGREWGGIRGKLTKNCVPVYSYHSEPRYDI